MSNYEDILKDLGVDKGDNVESPVELQLEKQGAVNAGESQYNTVDNVLGESNLEGLFKQESDCNNVPVVVNTGELQRATENSLEGQLVTGVSRIKRAQGRLDATMKKGAELLVMRDINGMTVDEIATELGVNRSTLYRWRQRKDFNDYCNNLADELNRGHLSDAYIQLRNILAYGRPSDKLKAIELLFKTQGKLKDVQETKATVEADISVESILNNLGL